jgi:hypothetical protein
MRQFLRTGLRGRVIAILASYGWRVTRPERIPAGDSVTLSDSAARGLNSEVPIRELDV